MLFFNSNQEFNSIFESLEDRVLFDGVPDATFVLPQTDVDQPAPAQVQDAQAADISGPRELILVDAGVADSDQFLAEVLEANPDSMFEIRFLDSDQDGIEQISQLLSAEDAQYSAIHIISHGDEGEVVLGNSSLTADNLNQYVDQLAGWADALTEDADLLFYGCDLAGNAEGESFIESISAVTGADVAASDDLTGAAELGGDWDLELNVGTIETAALIAENWDHVLGSGVTVQPGNGSEFQATTATTDVFFVGNNTNGDGDAESGFNATVTGAGGTITSITDFANPTTGSTAFNGGTFSVSDNFAGDGPTVDLTTDNGFQSGTAGNAVQIDPVSAGNGTVVTTITFNLTTPSNAFAVDIIDTFDVGAMQGDVTLDFIVDGVLQGSVSAPDNGPNLDTVTTATYFDADGTELGTGRVGNGLENFFGVVSNTNISTVQIVHTSVNTGNGRDVFALDSIRLASVTIPNQPPVAVDETVSTAFETPIVIDPLANDSDPDGDSLTITEINGVALTGGVQMITVTNGIVNIAADETITVTPDMGFTGTINIPYTIEDVDGATATATHSVIVENDPPVVVDPDPTPGTPSIDPADFENIIVPAVDGTPITIDLDDYLSDPEGDSLTITPDSLPTEATFNSTTNELTFTPAIDNVGNTVINFTVTDGNGNTISPTVTIQPVNPAPVAVNETVSTAFETPIEIDPLCLLYTSPSPRDS